MKTKGHAAEVRPLLRRSSIIVTRNPLAVRIRKFKPDHYAAWANWLLRNRKISPASRQFMDAMDPDGRDPVAHHAAWIFYLAAQLSASLRRIPADLKDDVTKAVSQAFEIGAHHEAITVEKNYRLDVQRSLRSMAGASLGGTLGAERTWQDRPGRERAIELYKWRRLEGDSHREARAHVRDATGYSGGHLTRILPKQT